MLLHKVKPAFPVNFAVNRLAFSKPMAAVGQDMDNPAILFEYIADLILGAGVMAATGYSLQAILPEQDVRDNHPIVTRLPSSFGVK